MTKQKQQYLIIITYISMFVMAISDSAKGIFVPTFREAFSVSDTAIGTFLLIQSLSFMIATFLGGPICDKIGEKKIIIMGMSIAAIGFCGTAFATSYIQLLVSYAISGFGVASMLLGMNLIIPLLKVSYAALLMNWLHSFYGIGSTVTQKLSGYLLYIGVSWRYIYMGYSALYVIVAIFYLFVEPPKHQISKTDGKSQTSFNKKLFILCSIALGFYISSEIQTANWLLNYLKVVEHLNTNSASTYIAIFFAIFSLGRIIGGFVVEKIGYLKSIIISSFLALITYTSGLILGGKFLFLLSFSGIFFSIVFPTFLIIIQNIFHQNPTKATSTICTIGSAICMFVGFLIGLFNDLIGTQLSMYLIPISIGIVLISMVLINIEIKKENIY